MPEHNSMSFLTSVPVKNPASEMVSLTVDERIEFKNAMIQMEIDKHNSALEAGWMDQEFVTFRFISREYFGNPSDETMHKKLDLMKVPSSIKYELWQAFKNAS